MKKAIIGSIVLACSVSVFANDFAKMDRQYLIQDICEESYHEAIVPLAIMARSTNWEYTERRALNTHIKYKKVMSLMRSAIMKGAKVDTMSNIADKWWNTCNTNIDDLAKVWGH